MADIADLVEADTEWLLALPPDEAANIAELLEREPDELRVAEIWVSSKLAYASDRPGEAADAADKYSREFVLNVRDEVHDFLCREDRYVGEKRELQGYGEAGKTTAAVTISAAIAPYIGEFAPIAIGVVALILLTIRRIGIKAWCKTESARRKLA